MRLISTLIGILLMGGCAMVAPDGPSMLSETVLGQLEKRLNISFEGTRPEVRYSLTPGTVLNQTSIASFYAQAHWGKDLIRVNEGYRACSSSMVFDNNVTKVKSEIEGMCDGTAIAHVLAHELGHLYTALAVRKYRAQESWLGWIASNVHMPSKTEAPASRMIDEGIGRYFEYAFHPHLAPKYSDLLFTRRFLKDDDALVSLIYEGGHSIVRPALDVNVAHAIRCFIENPLQIPFSKESGHDFTVLHAYRHMMVECAKSYRAENRK